MEGYMGNTVEFERYYTCTSTFKYKRSAGQVYFWLWVEWLPGW